MWGVVATFLFCFLCVPLRKLWQPRTPGHCMDERMIWVLNACFTLLTDVLILLIPLPYVWSMRTRHITRFGITLAFALGSS